MGFAMILRNKGVYHERSDSHTLFVYGQFLPEPDGRRVGKGPQGIIVPITLLSHYVRK